MLGTYLDLLPDSAKDRIIRAQEWGGDLDGGVAKLVDPVDHAELSRAPRRRLAERAERLMIGTERVMIFGLASRRRLRDRFLRVAGRVGHGRAVRLVKLRAARCFNPRIPADEAGLW